MNAYPAHGFVLFRGKWVQAFQDLNELGHVLTYRPTRRTWALSSRPVLCGRDVAPTFTVIAPPEWDERTATFQNGVAA